MNIALLIALGCMGLAAGELPPMQAWVPRDAMAVYWGRPSSKVPASGPTAAQQMATWVVTLKAMGVIPREGRALADMVGTLPLLGGRAYALVLLDITSKQLAADSYRLDTMQSALVMDSRGLEVEIDRRLRDLLATYTDAETGHVERLNMGPVTYYRLTDKRLPDWAVIEWGRVDGLYLVGFGEQAFHRMLNVLQHRSPSLADDPWFMPAHVRCRGATSGLEVYVDLQRVRTRVGAVATDRVNEVEQALGLVTAERLLWTVGFDGRALRSEIVAREGEQNHHVILAGPELVDAQVAERIPAQAAGYAAFRFPIRAAVENIRDAYLQSQSADSREGLEQAWAKLAAEHHFDATGGLLEPLGDHLIVHTYPPHPLKVPGLWTIWIQHHGDKTAVAQTVDRMMTGLSQVINAPPKTQPGEEGKRGPRFTLSPKLLRDPGGIWYLQLGLVGPAVGVGEGWIVISFSPEAVRANLTHLENKTISPIQN